jgi:hypothetical protein
VALTGYGQDEDRRRSQAAGFDVHLTKPIDPQALCLWLSQQFDANAPRFGPIRTSGPAGTTRPRLAPEDRVIRPS